MRRLSKPQIFGLAAVFACAGFGVAFAAAETSKKGPLARELATVVKELNELRKQRQELTPAAPPEADELVTLRQRITETERQIAALRAGQPGSNGPASKASPEASKAADPALAPAADVHLGRAVKRAQSALTHIVEQQRGLGRDVSQWIRLQKELSDPELQPQALKRFLQQAPSVVGEARQVSMANRPVMLDGGKRRTHAFVLEIGSLGRVFLSEDEQEAGVWDGQAWRTDIDVTTRDNIRAAVRSARRLEYPRFLSLPVPRASQPTPAAPSQAAGPNAR